jgi:hypothetical protein
MHSLSALPSGFTVAFRVATVCVIDDAAAVSTRDGAHAIPPRGQPSSAACRVAFSAARVRGVQSGTRSTGCPMGASDSGGSGPRGPRAAGRRPAASRSARRRPGCPTCSRRRAAARSRPPGPQPAGCRLSAPSRANRQSRSSAELRPLPRRSPRRRDARRAGVSRASSARSSSGAGTGRTLTGALASWRKRASRFPGVALPHAFACLRSVESWRSRLPATLA